MLIFVSGHPSALVALGTHGFFFSFTCETGAVGGNSHRACTFRLMGFFCNIDDPFKD